MLSSDYTQPSARKSIQEGEGAQTLFPTAYPGLVKRPFGARLSLMANAAHRGIFAFLRGRRIADWFFEPLIRSSHLTFLGCFDVELRLYLAD